MSSGEKLFAVGNVSDQLLQSRHRVLRSTQIRDLHEREATPEQIEAIPPSFEVLDHLLCWCTVLPLPNPVTRVARSGHTIRNGQYQTLDRDALRR